MPRPVATFFGLLLVAFAIGFNVWRHPSVWPAMGETVGNSRVNENATVRLEVASATPAPPDDSLQPSAPTSPTKPAESASKEHDQTPPSALPATQGDAKPAVATPTASIPSAPTETSSAATPSVPAKEEKPLVPVPRVVAAAAPIGAAANPATVRRLPPVDPDVSPLPTTVLGSTGGAIPIYPSTGIK